MNTHKYYICVLSAVGSEVRFGDIKVRLVRGGLQYLVLLRNKLVEHLKKIYIIMFKFLL